MSNDKTVIFIYYNGKIIEGKISNEIINNELIESIDNMLEKLDISDSIKLHEKIRAIIIE